MDVSSAVDWALVIKSEHYGSYNICHTCEIVFSKIESFSFPAFLCMPLSLNLHSHMQDLLIFSILSSPVSSLLISPRRSSLLFSHCLFPRQFVLTCLCFLVFKVSHLCFAQSWVFVILFVKVFVYKIHEVFTKWSWPFAISLPLVPRLVQQTRHTHISLFQNDLHII